MGTVFAVQVIVDPVHASDARRAIDASLTECARLEQILSEWIPTSPISQVNAAAGKGPVKVPPELLDVAVAAQELHRRSEGAFDVTWAAFRGLWNFKEGKKIPSDAAIAERQKRVGGDRVLVDPAASTIALKDAGMAMGLGGIAKGYAVAKMAAVLRKAGFTDFMIFGGGQVYVGGHKGERKWRVGVLDPRDENAYFAKIPLSDVSMATSGDYERFFMKDGVRYHHILDLRTGKPARAGLSSVTVIAEDPTLADGLSTAVFVLGAEKGLKLLESYPGAEGALVETSGKLHVTAGLKNELEILRQPGSGP